ncbi:Spo71p [Rhodotorula paludigena]|uniref:Spo71p n=1 Tax=Rhodotorula paludigena TaxID=86838 RepID=UPI003171A602
MNGPPASDATTSCAQAAGPTLAERRHTSTHSPFTAGRGSASTPSLVPLASEDKKVHLYTQPDIAVKTKDERLPSLETKHAGLTVLRRVFIGPSFQAQGEPNPYSLSNSGGANMGKGKGRADDVEGYGEAQRGSFPLRRRRRASTSATVSSATPGGPKAGESYSWSGASFEIGGDIREAARRRDARLARQREEQAQRVREHERVPPTPVSSMPKSPALTTGASFVTARTHLAPPTNADFQLKDPPQQVLERVPGLAHAVMRRPSDPPALHIDTDALSDGDIVAPIHRPELPHLRSILRTQGSAPPGLLGAPEAGKANGLPLPSPATTRNAVRFPDEDPKPGAPAAPGSGAKPPAPPSVVLARPDPETLPAPPTTTERLVDGLRHPVHHHQPSGGAVARRKKRPGDEILRKELMLVRVDWTQRDDLPDAFDEHVARKYPTSNESWEELAVVWRASGHVELWSEFKFNLPASFLKRKKLKAVIALNPKKTHFSLYSSTDLVFCLTHRPNAHSYFHSSSRTAARTGEPDEKTVDGPSASVDDDKKRARHSKASKRGYVHLRTAGTNIFLFRARTHDVAKEWIWRLYRSLGGKLPRSLEISVPGLGAKLRLPVPEGLGLDDEDEEDEVAMGEEDERAYRHLQPQAVVDACIEQLGGVPEWQGLVEEAKRQGADFRLAWRRGSTLDWVRPDAKGEKKRDWVVVGGVAFRQNGMEPVLELRPTAHYPTTCRIPAEKGSAPSQQATSTRISEPPGIEGFLVRHRKNGHPERIYLASRMGMLFITRPAGAHPPEPPMPVRDAVSNPAAVVLAPFVFGMASLAAPNKKKRDKLWRRVSRGTVFDSKLHRHERRRDFTMKSMTAAEAADEIFGTGSDVVDGTDAATTCDGNAMIEWLEREERHRGFLQVTDSPGFVDLSELETIEAEAEEDPRDQFARVVDVGGKEGLRLADDKAKLRKLRSFVVKTRSGVTVCFECHSIEVRREWVGRLQALSTYWRTREKADATQQMELAPQGGLVNKLPPRNSSRRVHAWEDVDDGDGEAPPTRNEILSSSSLATLYNWCLLENCRAVMLKRVMHVKRGLRGMFRSRHVLLLPGILAEYQTHTRDINGQPLPTPYHRRRKLIALRDCYVYSGSLASHLLSSHAGSSNNWDPADESEHQFPRCYPHSDGLRAADDVEDCTFVILRVKHSKSGANIKLGQSGGVARVYRARSKLERDQFVYALNASIERILRGEKEREGRLRDFPWLARK